MFESVKVSSRGKVDAVVVGIFKGESLDRRSAALDEYGLLTIALDRATDPGAAGAVTEAVQQEGPALIAVGLGDKDSFTPAVLRTAAAALGRRVAGTTTQDLDVRITHALASLPRGTKVTPERAGQLFGESLGLLAWVCDDFRGSATTPASRRPLRLRSEEADFDTGVKHGLGIATSANIARTLSETPPNVATPAYIASEAQKMARETGLKCTVIKGERLEREQLTGLINVGKASENAPCMIRLEYRPARVARGTKPLVLVGKTMTYDSGGLSIKVGGSMRGMKRDKDGGCAVFGAMHAIATVIKPNFPVVALLASAENSISDEAYRPDDIITFRNGVSVEVTNTDAEGRLVLADALCWACEKEKPGRIVDFATLTGGVVVALGGVYAGMWCDDDALRTDLESAADATGERVWRLPHHDDYRAMMRSSVADIVNSAPVRAAHPIQGAAFLSYFVDKDIPWAHVDIAGTHAVEKDTGPFIPGPTGFGARLAAELAALM